MTTYINQIVQLTRQMQEVDPAVTLRAATPETAARHQELTDQRYELVLAAVKDGVDPDLMRWAIDINDHPAKVQLQHAIAHAAAADALMAEPEAFATGQADNDNSDSDAF